MHLDPQKNQYFPSQGVCSYTSSFRVNELILSARWGMCLSLPWSWRFTSFSFPNMSLREASLIRNCLSLNLTASSSMRSSSRNKHISSRSSNFVKKCHIRTLTSLDRGTFIFPALVSSIRMDTISIAAGRMSSSAIVCGFLHFAILYATLYDASCALLLNDAVVWKRFSCFLYSYQFSLGENWWLSVV